MVVDEESIGIGIHAKLRFGDESDSFEADSLKHVGGIEKEL